jgi:hypothetical protein
LFDARQAHHNFAVSSVGLCRGRLRDFSDSLSKTLGE